jgi:hypothetical protein
MLEEFLAAEILAERTVEVAGADGLICANRTSSCFVSGKQTPSGGSGDRSDIGSGHNELL